MPGCFSRGETREAALTNVVEATALRTEVEAEGGRAPLGKTPAVVASAVGGALEIADNMRRAGETPDDTGYTLKLAVVRPRRRAVA